MGSKERTYRSSDSDAALLDSKADVNAGRHTDGVMPLWIAAQEGHRVVVKLLLDNRADVNVRNKQRFHVSAYCCWERRHRCSETVIR